MNLTEINETRRTHVREWARRKGIKLSPQLTFIHLVEEIGELARQINNPGLNRDKTDIDNLKEELSDCLILLLGLTDYYDIDIEKEIIKRIENIKAR